LLQRAQSRWFARTARPNLPARKRFASSDVTLSQGQSSAGGFGECRNFGSPEGGWIPLLFQGAAYARRSATKPAAATSVPAASPTGARAFALRRPPNGAVRGRRRGGECPRASPCHTGGSSGPVRATIAARIEIKQQADAKAPLYLVIKTRSAAKAARTRSRSAGWIRADRSSNQ
jgi:hypothetical protein